MYVPDIFRFRGKYTLKAIPLFQSEVFVKVGWELAKAEIKLNSSKWTSIYHTVTRKPTPQWNDATERIFPSYINITRIRIIWPKISWSKKGQNAVFQLDPLTSRDPHGSNTNPWKLYHTRWFGSYLNPNSTSTSAHNTIGKALLRVRREQVRENKVLEVSGRPLSKDATATQLLTDVSKIVWH